MITFSFSPSRRSILPSIEASVSTFVVSWNDAAERNDSVASDAFVIPRISGSKVAGLLLAAFAREFSRSSTTRSTSWPGQQLGVAGALDAHLLQHLADDQLDVLVVDLDALRLVDLLHLGDEVQLGRRRALEREQLGRVARALVERVARLDDLAVRRRAAACGAAAGTRPDPRARRPGRARSGGSSPSGRARSARPRRGRRSRRASRRPSGCGPRRSRRRAGGRA